MRKGDRNPSPMRKGERNPSPMGRISRSVNPTPSISQTGSQQVLTPTATLLDSPPEQSEAKEMVGNKTNANHIVSNGNKSSVQLHSNGGTSSVPIHSDAAGKTVSSTARTAGKTVSKTPAQKSSVTTNTSIFKALSNPPVKEHKKGHSRTASDSGLTFRKSSTSESLSETLKIQLVHYLACAPHEIKDCCTKTGSSPEIITDILRDVIWNS